MKVTFIVSLAMAILIAIFALMNGTTVPVNLGFMKLEASLALVILVSVAIGAIIVYLMDLVGKYKNRKKRNEMTEKIKSLESALEKKEQELQQFIKENKAQNKEKEPSKPEGFKDIRLEEGVEMAKEETEKKLDNDNLI